VYRVKEIFFLLLELNPQPAVYDTTARPSRPNLGAVGSNPGFLFISLRKIHNDFILRIVEMRFQSLQADELRRSAVDRNQICGLAAFHYAMGDLDFHKVHLPSAFYLRGVGSNPITVWFSWKQILNS
jgi:hypothetical protein